MTIVDCFAGPGGWSEGLAAFGRSEVGIEHDAAACATRAAAGHLTVRADVALYPPERFAGAEGFIASPPCPTFSAAGKGEGVGELPHLHAHIHDCVTGWKPCPYQSSDPRTPLVLEPLRWVDAIVPTWIALEQVPPVLPLWESMAHVLRAWGYSVWCGILNSADFGVPQTRRRAILMAHHTRPVTPPAPTHAKHPGTALFGQLEPWVSMADALGWGISDGPCMTVTGGGTEAGGAEPIAHPKRAAAAAAARGAWLLRDRRTNGAVRDIDEPAPTICAAHDNGNLAFVLHTNRDQRPDGSRQIREGSARAPALTAKAGGQWAFERLATTIVGSFCPDVVAAPGYRLAGDGPRQDAEGSIKITVQDALVLQSFRSDYPLQGSRTKQFEQVGNAIPPLLARAVCAVLLEEHP